MAALTAALIGGALLGGVLASKKKKKAGDTNDYQLTRDPAAAPAAKPQLAAQKVAATKPVDAVKAESENQASALQAARGVRRRAVAGNAGRVSTGRATPQQTAVRATTAPHTLVGY